MKRSIISICVAFAFIIVGSVLCSFEFLNFDIVDKFEDSDLTTDKAVYNLKLNGDNNIVDTTHTLNNIIEHDTTLEVGNIRLEVTYYNELMNIKNFSMKTLLNTPKQLYR